MFIAAVEGVPGPHIFDVFVAVSQKFHDIPGFVPLPVIQTPFSIRTKLRGSQNDAKWLIAEDSARMNTLNEVREVKVGAVLSQRSVIGTVAFAFAEERALGEKGSYEIALQALEANGATAPDEALVFSGIQPVFSPMQPCGTINPIFLRDTSFAKSFAEFYEVEARNVFSKTKMHQVSIEDKGVDRGTELLIERLSSVLH